MELDLAITIRGIRGDAIVNRTLTEEDLIEWAKSELSTDYEHVTVEAVEVEAFRP